MRHATTAGKISNFGAVFQHHSASHQVSAIFTAMLDYFHAGIHMDEYEGRRVSVSSL